MVLELVDLKESLQQVNTLEKMKFHILVIFFFFYNNLFFYKYIGICLGMQCAAVEFARNVCNITNANSVEFIENLKPENQVINFFL